MGIRWLVVGVVFITGCTAAGPGSRLYDDTTYSTTSGSGGSAITTSGTGGGAGQTSTTNNDGGSQLIDAGQQPDCVPGAYAGEFEGSVTIENIPVPVFGTVNMVLEQQEEGWSGEFPTLVIKDGYLEGEALGFPYEAALEGTLNCETLQLENGRLVDGIYIWNNTDQYFWEGTIKGAYNPQQHAFYDGEWEGEEANGFAIGVGTWSASLSP